MRPGVRRRPGNDAGNSWLLSLSSSVRHAQALVHDGTGGGVLQKLFLLRKQVMLDGERRQRGFVKARQDQLFLTRVGIDIADGKNTRQARLEFLGVDLERLLLQRQSPVRDRTEFRMQAEKYQQLIRRQRLQRTGAAPDVDAAQYPALDDQRLRQRFEVAHAPGRDLLLHFRDIGGRGAKLGAPMHERERRGARQQLERPVERGVAAAKNNQALTRELAGTLHPVLDGAAFEDLRPFKSDASRLERTHTAGDDDGASVKVRPGAGCKLEAPVFTPRKRDHLVPEMQLRLEGLDLLQESIDQLLGAAHRQRRDVVDRLVWIQLRALPTRMLQRIHHVRADAEQPELEHLEQATGTGTNDDDLGADHRGVRAGCSCTQRRSPSFVR